MILPAPTSQDDDIAPALRAAVDHAIAFRRSLPARPPRPTADAEGLMRLFGGPTPEQGEAAEDVIEALVRAAEPGLMAQAGPRFFGWVIGASHPVGVAADWLTSAWAQNAGMFAGSPSAATAEMVVARWLLDLLDLPEESSVGFVTGATMANFVCLAAARTAQYAEHGWDVEADGLIGAPPLHVFVGDDAHATVFSALRYLGLGRDRAVRVPTDDEGRMDPRALESLMAFVEGPKIIVAQAGQINTGAFDPLARIAAIARVHGAWLHIDGAFGLWARASADTRHLAEGAELADSWATDGHKWLQLPYDSGFAIVRHEEAHRGAMSVAASYLPLGQSVIEHDPSQYAPELSRRARGFAAWAVLRALGRAGVAEMVSRHCALARRLAARLNGVDGVEILNDVALNQVIVGFAGSSGAEADALTRAVIDELQRENECFAGGARWRGRWVMRVSVISGPLHEEDIDRLADAIIRAWSRVRAAGAAA